MPRPADETALTRIGIVASTGPAAWENVTSQVLAVSRAVHKPRETPQRLEPQAVLTFEKLKLGTFCKERVVFLSQGQPKDFQQWPSVENLQVKQWNRASYTMEPMQD